LGSEEEDEEEPLLSSSSSPSAAAAEFVEEEEEEEEEEEDVETIRPGGGVTHTFSRNQAVPRSHAEGSTCATRTLLSLPIGWRTRKA
jgi:hypothetical protein